MSGRTDRDGSDRDAGDGTVHLGIPQRQRGRVPTAGREQPRSGRARQGDQPHPPHTLAEVVVEEPRLHRIGIRDRQAAAVDALDGHHLPAVPPPGRDPEADQTTAVAERRALHTRGERRERAQGRRQRLARARYKLREEAGEGRSAPLAGPGIQLSQARPVIAPDPRAQHPKALAVPADVHLRLKGPIARIERLAAGDPAAIGQQQRKPVRGAVAPIRLGEREGLVGRA